LQEISIRINWADFVAAFPEGAGPSFQFIYIPGLATGQPLHELANISEPVSGFHNQMNMIGHQAIAEDS
jgi:hypothetical protein